jgi:methyl-accepting chemotaxis protein
MLHNPISTADEVNPATDPDRLAKVAMGCSDVSNIVRSVIVASERLRAEHGQLQQTVAAFEAEQREVKSASNEARRISENALERLGEGRKFIGSSLSQISDLISLVDALTQHVTGFAAAMDQVRRCSQSIEQLTDTTNILALNAAIEAARAGEAGRSFAVVANEVKGLAAETQKATNEIARTVDALGAEAERVVKQIEGSAEASSKARNSIGSIEDTVLNVCEMLVEVDGQNDKIAGNAADMNEHVRQIRDVVSGLDRSAIENEQMLGRAANRLDDLI